MGGREVGLWFMLAAQEFCHEGRVLLTLDAPGSSLAKQMSGSPYMYTWSFTRGK